MKKKESTRTHVELRVCKDFEAVVHATKLYRMEKVSRACHTETSGSLKTSRTYLCINGTRWAISVSSFVHCKGKGNRD